MKRGIQVSYRRHWCFHDRNTTKTNKNGDDDVDYDDNIDSSLTDIPSAYTHNTHNRNKSMVSLHFCVKEEKAQQLFPYLLGIY